MTRRRLLEDVKIQLNITWTDFTTDSRVLALIDNGAAYLGDKLGENPDFLSPGFPRSLMFEYVRYARDEALDVFENNYQSLILAMQHNRRVAAYDLESTKAPGT